LSRRARWGEQAILFRTNIQARPLETALRQASVRYHLIGGQSFFDRREVRDLLAYLKTFLNPHDDVSLLRIANVPPRGLSDVTMERLLGDSHARKCSVFSVMKNPAVTVTFQERTRSAIEAFAQFIEHQRAALLPGSTADPASLSLQRWADHFLDSIGYFNDLRRSEKDPQAAEPRIRNIKELIATLDEGRLGLPPLERLENFLEDITLDTEREEEEEPGDAVTLITMHSCKGLEFPHVYVVGLEDGLLPHARSKEEGTLDEERRLFYVAITRAMRTLSISHCRTRKKYGLPHECRPSPFLHDLPMELVEHANENARKPVPAESGKSRFDVLRSAIE
jgi:superfamily I DNA/RNA helicase